MSAAIPPEDLSRLTVAQYHDMIRAGILTEDEPVELLQGWLVKKMPKNPQHSVVTQLTREAIAALLPSDWYVDAQEPITTEDSEPEPDVVVVRGSRRQFLNHHPGPIDVGLIVEVAESSLHYDRTAKKQLYATVGVPVYWIINLADRQIEVYSDPHGEDYEQRIVYSDADTLSLVLDDQEVGQIMVRELLP